jgi:hypothetical protein
MGLTRRFALIEQEKTQKSEVALPPGGVRRAGERPATHGLCLMRKSRDGFPIIEYNYRDPATNLKKSVDVSRELY